MTFVVQQKGLRVIEDYISAYLKLYESVYFHKTTRGIQFLVDESIKAALRDIAMVRERGIASPLLEYFFLPPDQRLTHYLALDDSDVTTLLKQLATRDLGDASMFAQRFLARQPFRCFEPNDPNRDIDFNRTKELRKRLDERGIRFHLDFCKEKGFKVYDPLNEEFLKNIMIKVDGRPHPIGQVDPGIITKVRMRCRFYFLTENDRTAAEKIWRSA
jgi:HD superfamily phosphohydrolase